MNSFKEKFKIAKILASLFTHSSTPEEEKNYHAWLDENPEHQKIADRILNKETYEENSQLIKNFSSQKAWEKVYPLLGTYLFFVLVCFLAAPHYKWSSGATNLRNFSYSGCCP